MREILFRAWMTIEGDDEPTMVDHHDLAFEFFEPLKDQLASIEHLMQYTGIEDRDATEIFEGDIVKSYHESYEESKVSVVTFEKGTFSLGRYWKDGVHEWCSMEQYHRYHLEVIGNIHENPELLNNNNEGN